MLYGQHAACPPLDVFEKYKYEIPNFSMRMSNLVGALLRTQLQTLDDRCRRWNLNYRAIEAYLQNIPRVKVIKRDEKEQFVGSSIQFLLCDFTANQIIRIVEIAANHGVHIKWFGRQKPEGFTSRHFFWKFTENEVSLPETDAVLNGLCDIRVPVDLTDKECKTVATVIRESIGEVLNN
jgi:dTDP-4-amino-4,6-dideoxygalactose transaminase